MRRLSSISAFTLLLSLWSCSTPEADREPILFTSFVSETKAEAVTGTTLPSTASIGITGYHCDEMTWDGDETPETNFFNLLMNGDGSYHDAASVQYWPDLHTGIRIFAYYPYEAQDSPEYIHLSSPSAAGAPSFDFTTPDVANQFDLMTSVTATLRRQYLPVNLTFTHTLSRVVVASKKLIGVTDEVKITEARLTNIYADGRYNFLTGWSSLATPTSYTIPVPTDFYLNDTNRNLFGTSGQGLLLIPQDGQDAYLEVTMEITPEGQSPRTVTKAFPIRQTKPLVMGRTLILNLDYTANTEGYMTISLSYEVADWTAHKINTTIN